MIETFMLCWLLRLLLLCGLSVREVDGDVVSLCQLVDVAPLSTGDSTVMLTGDDTVQCHL